LTPKVKNKILSSQIFSKKNTHQTINFFMVTSEEKKGQKVLIFENWTFIFVQNRKVKTLLEFVFYAKLDCRIL
jgi:hypothetical protein